MKKIRSKVFETNSSSTHSITSYRDKREIPQHITLKPGWFGSYIADDYYDNCEMMLSYLFSFLLQEKDIEGLLKLFKILLHNGIEVHIADIDFDKVPYCVSEDDAKEDCNKALDGYEELRHFCMDCTLEIDVL